MVGVVVAVGFVGMVLAPCGIAIYSRLGSASESQAERQVKAVATELEPVDAPPPPNELTAHHQVLLKRRGSLSTADATPAPVPVPVPSLREVAERAAREAVQAQAAAAQAQVQALQELSRAASKRAATAEKLAEAAERELVRATQAALQAEASKLQARQAQQGGADRDYLPHDHPSLDFPRSRVPSRRVA